MYFQPNILMFKICPCPKVFFPCSLIVELIPLRLMYNKLDLLVLFTPEAALLALLGPKTGFLTFNVPAVLELGVCACPSYAFYAHFNHGAECFYECMHA